MSDQDAAKVVRTRPSGRSKFARGTISGPDKTKARGSGDTLAQAVVSCIADAAEWQVCGYTPRGSDGAR